MDATGEVEFKDSPCKAQQTEKAVPKTVLDTMAPAIGADEETAILAIMDDDREKFRAVCEG